MRSFMLVSSTWFVVAACSPREIERTREANSALAGGIAEALSLALDAGLVCDPNLIIAGAIAVAESDLDPNAVNFNPPTPGCPNGSRDRGLWQINDCYHAYSDACAFDPACNARAMAAISSGGTNWRPWSTYTAGVYANDLGLAQSGFDAVCGGDRGYRSTPGQRPTQGPFEALDIGAAIPAGAFITECLDGGERVWQTDGTGRDESSSWGAAAYPQQPVGACGDEVQNHQPIVFRSADAGSLRGTWVTACDGHDNVELVFFVDNEVVDGHPAATFQYPQIDGECP
jgi:hypothetical protein